MAGKNDPGRALKRLARALDLCLIIVNLCTVPPREQSPCDLHHHVDGKRAVRCPQFEQIFQRFGVHGFLAAFETLCELLHAIAEPLRRRDLLAHKAGHLVPASDEPVLAAFKGKMGLPVNKAGKALGIADVCVRSSLRAVIQVSDSGGLGGDKPASLRLGLQDADLELLAWLARVSQHEQV